MSKENAGRSPRCPGFHYFLVVSYEAVMCLLFSLPRYRFCNWLKAALLKATGARIGRRVVFYPGVWITSGRKLAVGDDVVLAKDVLITSHGGVRIGDRTMVGYRTQILSRDHRIPPHRGKIFDSGHESKPVRIGPDAWIGANCLILPGAVIGEGAVVGAGAVVKMEVKPYTVVAGVPARTIREREA
ncbi:MAG: acyltransferase [Planctomycetota bacterium]